MGSVVDSYGLDFPVASFAISNEFNIMANKVCYRLGKNLTPFTIFARDFAREHKVTDFAQFGGIVDHNKTMIHEISEFWGNTLESMGYTIDRDDPLTLKHLMIDYMLTTSICYIEVPKYVRGKDMIGHNSYDKYLATKNPKLLTAWTGIDEAEATRKYSIKVSYMGSEFEEHEIRFVKPTYSAQKGNGISTVRKAVPVQGMNCIPLYMLYAWVQGMLPSLRENVIEFTYKKDAGDERVLNSTLDRGRFEKYYTPDFVEKVFNGVDIGSVAQGGMHLAESVQRGYIRVPEFGASEYDYSGVRALNVSRILSCKVVDEVDMRFVHVDLDNVPATFMSYISSVKDKGVMMKELAPSLPDSEINTIDNWLSEQKVIGGTSFNKRLHIYMIEHPEIFTGYTGLRSNKADTVRQIDSLTEGFVQL